MTGFAIIDGIPHVNDKAFPWAMTVNDNLAFPDWPWIGFTLRIESGWDIHVSWQRAGAKEGEPDGSTANVAVQHGDTASDRGGTSGIPTHVFDSARCVDPDWFFGVLDRAARRSPGPEDDLRLRRRAA